MRMWIELKKLSDGFYRHWGILKQLTIVTLVRIMSGAAFRYNKLLKKLLKLFSMLMAIALGA